MEEKRPTNRQVVGISIVTGIFMINLVSIVLQFGLNSLVSLAGIIFSSPWGIAGALIGRNWKNNMPSTWIGASIGTVIGLGSLFLALSFAQYSYSKGDFITPDLILYPLPGLPFGIIGVMLGKDWKQSNLAAWIGGTLGAIIGVILFGWLYSWASFGFASG